MLRSSAPVRTLGPADVHEALMVCARDPVTNVFVSARTIQSRLDGGNAALLARGRGAGESLCWAGVNVVPVQCDAAEVVGYTEEINKRRRSVSSIFGPAEPVLALWERLEPLWGRPREVRPDQPVLTMRSLPTALGVEVDPAVRTARPDEVDIVLPAAAAMFTEEIGYPPYYGSDRAYRRGIQQMIRSGHTYVRVEQGEVVFKADLGSVAQGVAQVQGVWLHPDLRGQGLAVAAMAAVVEHTLVSVASAVTLYVNAFNHAALATYRRVGFTQTGRFATVLM